MKLHIIGVVIGALVVCAPIAWGRRSFKVVFTSFPYEYNSNLLDAKVEIQNHTEETYLAITLYVREELDDLRLKYAITMEQDEGKSTALINGSLNFCKFLKQRTIDPLLRLTYEDILKQGDFMKACPIAKGNYTLLKYRADEEMLPNYVPEADFVVDINLSKANGELLFDGKLHGMIDKSKAFDNFKMFSLG